MKILSTIKSKFKAFVALILTSAILLPMFAGAGVAQAANPRFNFLIGDWEMLRGANRTTNQTNWSDPVSGTAGDTFAAMVYYHNGMIDLTANNVRIKVTIPASTSNKTAVLSASVSADNASTVTDTIDSAGLVGKSGLTVKLNEESTLALVPGSIKWFPDYITDNQPNVALPLGQSGDEIVTGSGLNLGNIQGCWNHIGYVTFLFKTTAVAQASVAVNKTVRNVTTGETAFVKSNFAKPGDTLEYSVNVKNNGAGTANNLFLTDTIPAGTTYVANSTTMSKNGGSASAVAEGIVGDGVTIGSLATTETAEIRFKVKVGQNVTNGATLTNTAFLNFNKQILPSTASTVVKFGVTTPPIGGTLPVTGGGNTILTILTVISGGLAGVYTKYRKLLAIKAW
ncbi:MAG: hypothetical protein Q7S80_00105 [bacterium]|nr:hypothetical protein [bacterium]